MTEIWFKSQRVIRTALQVFLSAVAILATVTAVAPQVLTAISDVLPGPVVAWLAGAIAFLTAISAALARVMAIPAVDEWLRKFGAGSAPAGAVTFTPTDGIPIGLTRRQYQQLMKGADTNEKGAPRADSSGLVYIDRVVQDGDALTPPEMTTYLLTEDGYVVIDESGRAHTPGGNPVRVTGAYRSGDPNA